MGYDLVVFYTLNSSILLMERVLQTDCNSSTNTAQLLMSRKLTVSANYKAYLTSKSLPENHRQRISSQSLRGERQMS